MEELIDINILEQKIINNLGLIEIAKKYCEAESDKSGGYLSLFTLLEIIMNNQYEIVHILDYSNISKSVRK